MRHPDFQTADGRVQLHCCDADELLASLDDKAVDIAVTSPPYNTLPADTRAYGFRRRSGGDRWLRKVADEGYDDQLPEQLYQHWLALVVAELRRVAQGLAWVNHKLRFRDGRGLHPLRYLREPVWSEVIWDRRGSLAMNCAKFAPSHEYLFGFGRPHWWDDTYNTLLSVWQIAPERGCLEHPCPFPIEIPRRLIAASCPPDGVVLDPFMGRGTTALACLELGRRFIGCDRSAEFFACARHNVVNAVWCDRESFGVHEGSGFRVHKRVQGSGFRVQHFCERHIACAESGGCDQNLRRPKSQTLTTSTHPREPVNPNENAEP